MPLCHSPFAFAFAMTAITASIIPCRLHLHASPLGADAALAPEGSPMPSASPTKSSNGVRAQRCVLTCPRSSLGCPCYCNCPMSIARSGGDKVETVGGSTENLP
jgi:hypothetical protein